MNHQILQLQPPIPVVTPMGDAIAHLVIDYSIEHSIHWVVFMEDTGQCWILPNEKIDYYDLKLRDRANGL